MADFYHETERLILRDWREEDWEPFFEGTNTPAVMEYLGGVMDEEGKAIARSRFASYRADHGHTFWVVERKEDGAILGFCGLKRSNEPAGPQDMMEVGWRLREEAWGKGYAKEAAIATLAIGFEQFDAPFIIALTVEGNRPSWGLMVRLGMEKREELSFYSNFFEQDAIGYRIDRAKWEASHR